MVEQRIPNEPYYTPLQLNPNVVLKDNIELIDIPSSELYVNSLNDILSKFSPTIHCKKITYLVDKLKANNSSIQLCYFKQYNDILDEMGALFIAFDSSLDHFSFFHL